MDLPYWALNPEAFTSLVVINSTSLYV